MARPKQNKTNEDVVKEAFELDAAQARKKRLEYYEALRASEDKEDIRNHRDEFKKFWSEKRTEYKRSKELEDIIWLHLKAIGKTKPEEFEEGIRHFGLKT